MLNDLSALDQIELIWVRITLCGVPPSPRECCAGHVIGPTLVIFGGRGRTCHDDCALFHLARDTRTGSFTQPEKLEFPGQWEHPDMSEASSGHQPRRLQGQTVCRNGSCKTLLFGGFSTDDDCWAKNVMHSAVVHTCRRERSLQVLQLNPKEAHVRGGKTVEIQGEGFGQGSSFMVSHAAAAIVPKLSAPSLQKPCSGFCPRHAGVESTFKSCFPSLAPFHPSLPCSLTTFLPSLAPAHPPARPPSLPPSILLLPLPHPPPLFPKMVNTDLPK